MPRNCCFCHILFELLKMEFTFLLRKCETFVRHFLLFELSFLSDLVFHWLFECYFSLNSLFLFLPLILLLFLRCGRCDVCFHPSSAWHTEGHPACLLWCRSGFFLATSALNWELFVSHSQRYSEDRVFIILFASFVVWKNM